MKKFKAMLAATAAVMALSAVSVPMSAFAEDVPREHNNPQKYTFDPATADDENTKHNTWDAAYGDQVGEPNPSARVNVDFSIAPTYTVTIPADVHFADGQREKDAQVKVEDVFLAPDSSVVVTVASSHDYRMLLNGNNNRYYIPYVLGTEQGGDSPETPSIVPIEDLVVTVPTGSLDHKESRTVDLKYVIGEQDQDNPDLIKPYDVPVAGSYSDILTFTIAVRTRS